MSRATFALAPPAFLATTRILGKFAERLLAICKFLEKFCAPPIRVDPTKADPFAPWRPWSMAVLAGLVLAGCDPCVESVAGPNRHCSTGARVEVVEGVPICRCQPTQNGGGR